MTQYKNHRICLSSVLSYIMVHKVIFIIGLNTFFPEFIYVYPEPIHSQTKLDFYVSL
jgi:hypothetical protein